MRSVGQRREGGSEGGGDPSVQSVSSVHGHCCATGTRTWPTRPRRPFIMTSKKKIPSRPKAALPNLTSEKTSILFAGTPSRKSFGLGAFLSVGATESVSELLGTSKTVVLPNSWPGALINCRQGDPPSHTISIHNRGRFCFSPENYYARKLKLPSFRTPR